MNELTIHTNRLLDDQCQLNVAGDRPVLPLLRDLCTAAELDVRMNDIGNLSARWCPPSAYADLPAVGTGSRFFPPARSDEPGNPPIGLVGGLEAIRALREADFSPRRPIELIAFTQQSDAADVADDAYHAWVELGREQGGKLDKQQAAVGIVMGIAGSARYVFNVEGEAGHAGSVPMPDRRDALCAAAEAIHGIEQLARSSPSSDLVGTVSTLEVQPGTADAIPAHARFTLDLRDVDEANRDQIADAIHDDCNTLAHRRGVKITSERIHAAPPAACDKAVIDAVERACDQLDLRWWKLISQARHRASFMARVAPVGVILIPNRTTDTDPAKENMSTTDLAAGVEVLALTLAELAG